MYSLYNSIQEKLPEDSSLKLIDVWLLHGLLMPMIVFVTLAANELIKPNADPRSVSPKLANSAVKITRQIDQDIHERNRNKMKICVDVWKALIPIFSTLFIIAYFIICFKN